MLRQLCLPALFYGVIATACAAQSFETLVKFDGNDGSFPAFISLMQFTDGHLYGTTVHGGSAGSCYGGCGTIFGITTDGSLQSVHAFCSEQFCTDGAYPSVGLTLSTDGDVFGVTSENGPEQDAGTVSNFGTIFRLGRDGKLATLHTFVLSDGSGPNALVQGIDGDFYGTTGAGGTGNSCSGGCGTIFKITSGGFFATLYNFQGPDGAFPAGPLIESIDRNFYGTTAGGGANNQGTIFKLSPGGVLTILYSFCSESRCADGAIPQGGVIQSSDGNFYGTTFLGGSTEGICSTAQNGCGTVFRLTRNGNFTTLYRFCTQGTFNCDDGADPAVPLVLATDGYFYGTALNYGLNGYGTVFKITPSGSLTTLHGFDSEDGANPEGGLLQSTDGNLYGPTATGGSGSCPAGACGTIFKWSTGLDPFVTFIRAAGSVGQTGGILGQGFTGTTSVALNAIPANFTVVSDTFIRATVPQGATTGFVTVTTPTGVLTSNVPFHVIQ